jgi:hypothetical protein
MTQGHVLTIDRRRIGRIVGEFDDYYVVEAGTFRRHRHALPKRLARTDERAGGMVVQMGRNILWNSPRIGSAEVPGISPRALAAYWGLED